MASICRLCATLKKLDNFVSIGEPNLNLRMKLQTCCQICIPENDSLPQNVCSECVQCLNNCWEFVTKVHEAQENLTKIFQVDDSSTSNQGIKIYEKLTAPVNTTVVEILSEDSKDSKYVGYEIEEVQYEPDNEIISEEEIVYESDMQVKFENAQKLEECREERSDFWCNYVWKCIECDAHFSTCSDLRTHILATHPSSDVQYICTDCSKVFGKYYSFINHVKSRHRTELLLDCDVCGGSFNNAKDLAWHRSSSHLDEFETLVICPVCAKAFRNQNALQIHSNCHQPDDVKYKYTCTQCNKKFGSKPNLKAHQKIHLGVKEFVCDQCGKGFVQKANLEEHLLTHINEKPYECQECQKRFKTPARLTKHKAVHSDIKPYKCKMCGREFREKDTLNVHMRIHTGAMPFECEYCGKKFRFKSILTTHRYQHTGERPYSCLKCNHYFTNWPNYNKHMKRRHGIDTSSTARKLQKALSSEIQNVQQDSALVTSTAEIPNLISDAEIVIAGSSEI